jgi:hypothetical protein
MRGGSYTVYNWADIDSPSVQVRRAIQTLTMEVGQIMKVSGACGGVKIGDRTQLCMPLPFAGMLHVRMLSNPGLPSSHLTFQPHLHFFLMCVFLWHRAGTITSCRRRSSSSPPRWSRPCRAE